jgi:hypothetical protein
VGADSGEVSFSLIGASVHPSINYVSFDFLRKVSPEAEFMNVQFH